MDCGTPYNLSETSDVNRDSKLRHMGVADNRIIAVIVNISFRYSNRGD